MGADNLTGFHLWQHWQLILKMMPIVVFDRAPYSFTSLSSKTYQRMRRFLLNNQDLAFNNKIPSLRFIHLQRDPNSSTDIRKKLGKSAFLIHNE
jgi:nicotinate-nucleotide adenylyltransferase